MQKKPEIPYIQEIFRKSIHLISLLIPIIYAFIEQRTAVWILACLFLPALALDIARHYIPGVKRFIAKNFAQMMRAHELDETRLILSGATYVLMSAFFCVVIFPKIIAITAFAVMIVSDISSALVGRQLGKHRFLDKSLEGTSAFWISAFGVVVVIRILTNAPMEYLVIGCIAAIAGGVVEAASIRLRMDDNLSIPLTIGLCMWGMLLLVALPVQQAVLALLR